MTGLTPIPSLTLPTTTTLLLVVVLVVLVVVPRPSGGALMLSFKVRFRPMFAPGRGTRTNGFWSVFERRPRVPVVSQSHRNNNNNNNTGTTTNKAATVSLANSPSALLRRLHAVATISSRSSTTPPRRGPVCLAPKFVLVFGGVVDGFTTRDQGCNRPRGEMASISQARRTPS